VSPLTLDSIVRTAGHAVSCELDGEAAILNITNGEYYGLDDVGSSVWRIMSQPHTVAEIVCQITSEYEVDAARCAADLIGLISKLAAHGLVDISDQT
jgi:Coenzyme PQQ synthesis protein D (PqqD)